MTDPAASPTAATASAAAPGAATPAPGWYPDGSGGQRWWDGTTWTQHTAPASAAAAAAAQPLQRTALPEGTKVDNLWIWLVSLSFLISCIPLFFFDMVGYMRAITFAELQGNSAGLGDAMLGYFGFMAITWVLGIAIWGLSVFAAYRDVKHLEQLGVVRPFHWAFAFIPYTIVYLIGRHVVLRKVVRTAGWPLWAHIAAYVVIFIGSIIWAIVIVQIMMTEMLGNTAWLA